MTPVTTPVVPAGLAASFLETVSCYSCGSDRHRPFLRAEDDLTGKPGVFTFVRCVDCGLVYQNPLAHGRVAAYPPFLSLSERQEFADIAADNDLLNLFQTQAGFVQLSGHPKIQAAADKLVAACTKHGKWAGMGGAYGEDLLKMYIGKGMKLVLAGNDLPMLTGAARAHQAKVRALAG